MDGGAQRLCELQCPAKGGGFSGTRARRIQVRTPERGVELQPQSSVQGRRNSRACSTSSKRPRYSFRKELWNQARAEPAVSFTPSEGSPSGEKHQSSAVRTPSAPGHRRTPSLARRTVLGAAGGCRSRLGRATWTSSSTSETQRHSLAVLRVVFYNGSATATLNTCSTRSKLTPSMSARHQRSDRARAGQSRATRRAEAGLASESPRGICS